MTNNEMFKLIGESCTVTAPDRFSDLSYEAAEQYKNTTPKISARKHYISAAVIYAAACILLFVAIPFIIGDGDNINPGTLPVTTDEPAITAAPETVPEDYLMPQDEAVLAEFLEAVDRAYAEGRITEEHDKSTCVEVTPRNVYEATGARIFTFNNNCYSYIYADGEAYGVWRNGMSVAAPSAVPIDYNGDGKNEILLSVSWTNKNSSKQGGLATIFDLDRKEVLFTKANVPYESAIARGKDNNGDLRFEVRKASFVTYPDRKFAVIPVAGDEVLGFLELREGKLVYEEYDSIREKILIAMDKAVADGVIEDWDYRAKALDLVLHLSEDDNTFIFSFEDNYTEYLYNKGELCLMDSGFFGTVYEVQQCDLNGNGVEDYLIYSRWGSGVDGYSLAHFDAETNSYTMIYKSAFRYVTVEEKADDNGNIIYELYAHWIRSNEDGKYIGTLEYKDGEIVTNLIYEGTVEEVVGKVLSDKTEETELPTTEPAETTATTTTVTTITTTVTSEPVTTPAESEPTKMETIEDKILKVDSDNLYSFLDSYKNDVYNSLYEMNGEKYGRIISSSESREDAVRVCTRHFTDNRFETHINTVVECNVIYESDILYGINVKWEVRNSTYEENVISFKKSIADITVQNVIYGDEETYSICASEEITEQIVLYLYYNKVHYDYNMMEYEMVSYDDVFIMTIYMYKGIGGDWGVHDEIIFQKYTVVVDKKSGLVQFREPVELKSVWGRYNPIPEIIDDM